LGQRTDDEIETLKKVIEIARKGGTAVVTAPSESPVDVLHNLRYLDLAVLLSVFRDSGLPSLISAVCGPCKAPASTVDVITALVLQRCVEPASKLAASRWFPETALPELLGVLPQRFNNSRVHRVLTDFEAAETDLQDKLPQHLFDTQGDSVAVLLDATDTWFEGQGPPMGAKGKDKHGLFRRRVGIVLLCDSRGFPLRWHTLDGKFHDPTALANMAAEVAELPWARKVPFVVDRALGGAGWTEKLDALKLRYLTCVPVTELRSCGAPMPWQVLEQMQDCQDRESLAKMALSAGFVRDGKHRYVLELGLFDKNRPQNTAHHISAAQFALTVIDALEAEPRRKIRVIAESLKVTRQTVRRYKPLLALSDSVRKRIRKGDADGVTLAQLHEVARCPADDQVQRLEGFIKTATGRQCARGRSEAPPPFKARAALSLNPNRFFEDRRTDEQRLAQIRERTESINRRLASPSSRRTDTSALGEVERLIRRLRFGDVCSTSMDRSSAVRKVVLEVNLDALGKRRKSYGISLIVSHPDVPGTAPQRVTRYFSKDTVEKDFQSIKSVLKLRPIRHRTDHKLRAHVSICMLAVLLTRLVEARLHAAGVEQTAPMFIEQTKCIHLNLVENAMARYYTITKQDQTVRELLKRLKLSELVDDNEVRRHITAR
jgi:hypothetical protein